MTELTRRAAIGAALAAPFLARAARAASPEAIRMGTQKDGPFVVLRAQKRLEESFGDGTRIDWITFASGPPMLEALNAGSIDFAAVGDTPPIFAQASGTEFLYLAATPRRGDSQAVIARPGSDITTPAALRGKRLGFTKGSSAHYLALRTLEAGGLSLDDVSIAYLAPPDAAAAFRQGAIDAWSIWDPFLAVTEGQMQGAVRVATSSIAPSSSFVLVRRGFAHDNPAATQTVLARLREVGDWAEAHRDDLAALFAGSTGVDLAAETIATRRGNYTIATLDDQAIAQQQGIADLFAKKHLIPAPVDVRRIVWTPGAT